MSDDIHQWCVLTGFCMPDMHFLRWQPSMTIPIGMIWLWLLEHYPRGSSNSIWGQSRMQCRSRNGTIGTMEWHHCWSFSNTGIRSPPLQRPKWQPFEQPENVSIARNPKCNRYHDWIGILGIEGMYLGNIQISFRCTFYWFVHNTGELRECIATKCVVILLLGMICPGIEQCWRCLAISLDSWSASSTQHAQHLSRKAIQIMGVLIWLVRR